MFHLPEEIQEYIFQMSTKLRFREKFMSDILENSSRISTLCESKKKYGVVICQIKEECCYTSKYQEGGVRKNGVWVG
jgi:hypothetical protein